ncbi:MAG: D-alanine--D-alanine ligase [Armatimonadota bacterium]
MVENKKIKVAVLMGGASSEREISLSTGKQVFNALDRNKYEVVAIDAGSLEGSTLRYDKQANVKIDAVEAAKKELEDTIKLESFNSILTLDKKKRPDVVFIALHGKYGEDGCVQGFLELMGLKYTGSGVLASSLAMDKSQTKKMLSASGIRVIPSVDFTYKNYESLDKIIPEIEKLEFPVIIKPSRQGSTIGMLKVSSKDMLKESIVESARYDRQIVVEKFIEGCELTVSVMGNDSPYALPVVEIVPKSGFYDYHAKYTPGATDEIVPARISDEQTRLAQKTAIDSYKAIGCKGYARVDIIMDNDSNMNVLEINTIPGMTPTSLLPRAAQAAGKDFVDLLDEIISYALEEV